ncbi:MAG: hypothetical protein JST07_04180 [Bacteroidetes bacterium]|nr:hypothetical protein [Bacteroidota bacterium]
MNKAFFILPIYFLISLKSFGQTAHHPKHSRNVVIEKMYDSILKKSGGNYISANITKGIYRQKSYMYLTIENKNLLLINFGDSIVKIKEILGESLLNIAEINLPYLKKVANYVENSKYAYYTNVEVLSNEAARMNKKFFKEYSDTSTIDHSMLSIKYNKFRYGSYPRFSEELITSSNNEKLAKGMWFINYLYKTFDELEKK